MRLIAAPPIRDLTVAAPLKPVAQLRMPRRRRPPIRDLTVAAPLKPVAVATPTPPVEAIRDLTVAAPLKQSDHDR